MSKFDKFLKKASQQMTSNLGRLEGKLDEFKTSASQHLQNLGSNTEWTTDDLVPQNFPVDMPARIDINGSSYRPVKLLDEGGFSFVFIAKNMETGQDFALKRLLIHEEEMLTSAMNEIKYMEKLNGHSNIIKLIGHKQIPKGSQTELYILMELADDSLISLLQKKADYGDRFKEDELLSIFLSICKAVAHMHEQNPPIIHRDLKVENVLITGGEYKLCDFGSCTTTVYHLQDKREKQRAEEDIQKNTTMAYWSPEMADLYSGYTIDEKSDVWALGCVLYKMCYFVGPFENASTLQIINCKYRIPDAKYSSEITDLIKYMLTVDPSKRPSVFDVIERISTILGLEANVHRPAPRQNQPKQMAPRQMAPRQQPAKQTSIKSPPPKSSSGGGDLFSMLDWVENDGQKTTPQSSSSDFDNAFGNDDWSADFSELDNSTTTAPKLQQQQQQPSKSPTTPSRPSHVRQVSNSSQSSSSSGLDLFSQLDWQPSNTTPSIRPPSPQNSSRSSSHSRNSSATTSADFTVDSLFQSQENTFTSAVKPSDLHKKRTWVIKATNGLPTQPKHKYVKRITVDVWEHNNLLEYLLLLRARPIFTKEVIAFKSLVLLHHVLQNGSQQSLKSARENLTFLTDMKDAWSSAKGTDPAFTRLIILYASYLVDRLSFSRAHPAFEPNFSLDRFMKTSGDISPLMGSTTPFNIAALLGLVELLQSLLEVQKASLADMTSPCKHGCIIPLVYDAEDLHNVIVYLSKRISKSIKPNDLNQAVTKFNNHYSQMIRFFTQVEKFPPLAAIVTVPQLPLSPPSVFSPNNVEPPKSIPPPPTYLRGNKPKQEYDEGFDSDLDDFETIDSENTIALELSVGEVSIKRISIQPGNTICADCPLKDPRIAVTNLGILICDPCYSVHRNLGEQFSKPQPLDNNLSTEQMRFLECVGNDRANKFWEANLTETKPNGTNAQALNTYIRNKYISKKYLSPAALRAPMPRNLSNPNLARPMPMGGPNFMNHPSPSRTRSFDANNFVPPQQQQFANTSPTAYQQPPFQQQQYQNGPFVPHHQRVQSNGSPTLDTLNVFQQFK